MGTELVQAQIAKSRLRNRNKPLVNVVLSKPVLMWIDSRVAAGKEPSRSATIQKAAMLYIAVVEAIEKGCCDVGG